MKPTRNKNLFYFLAAFLIGGCVEPDGNVPPPPPANDCVSIIAAIKEKADRNPHKPVYIILCDFTSSMDQESLDYISRNASKIFNSYYNKAILKFYPITNTSRMPFFESDMVTITDSSNIEEGDSGDFEDCILARKKELTDSLHTVLGALRKNRLHESYIVQGIENSLDIISLFDPKHTNQDKLFVLSDMLESGNSSFGSINLEDQSYGDDIKKVDSKNGKDIGSRFSSNIGLEIGFYSKNIKYQDKLSKFWNMLFSKLGYGPEVKLSAEIPSLN